MANEVQNTQMTSNQDTGANAGGPCRLPMRMRQAARVAADGGDVLDGQFCRYVACGSAKIP